MKLDIYTQQVLTEDGFCFNGSELIAPIEPRRFYQGDYHALLDRAVEIEELLPELTPMGQKMARFLNFNTNLFITDPYRERIHKPYEEFLTAFFWRRKLTGFILNNPEYFYPKEIETSEYIDGDWTKTQTKYLDGHFNSPWALANALADKGINNIADAIAFCDTYVKFQDPNRSFGSSKQINPFLVARVATEPRLKRLPYRCKKQFLFLHMDQYLGYPEYIDKNLSTQKIIDYIDSCSLIFQLRLSPYEATDLSVYPTLMEKISKAFFLDYGNRTAINSIMDLVSYWNGSKLSKGQWKVIEELADLPAKYLYEQFGQEPLDIEKILGYLDPKLVCRTLFGSDAKTIIASFKEANLTQIKWAEALQPSINGNIDVSRKILKVDCLPIEDKQTFVECKNFLNHLGWKPALRMLGKQTYKYRGEEHPVQEFLIRDTGYLFNQLTHLLGETPELGRVQCWLSVHENLSRQFIDITPDEVLPTHSLVKGLDGVASIKKNWTIIVPKNTRELKYYGEYLSFCIGGYGPYVQRGGIILLIEDGKGMPKYGIQIDPKPNGRGEIVQFYGVRNSYPEQCDREQIEETLKQAKVLF